MNKFKMIVASAMLVTATYFVTKKFYYYQLSNGQAGVACMVGAK
jgi:hypothetical protein